MRRRTRRLANRQPHLIRAGFGVIGVSLLVTILAFNGGMPIGGSAMRTVQVEVRDASNVRTNQPVRIRGVDVGRVSGVSTLPGGRAALISMEVERGKADLLRADAHATVWWRTLLGRNMYVELDPGQSVRPLGAARIPLARTDHQVELDQLTSALTPRARHGFQRTIRGLQQSTADPVAVGASIDAAGPALDAVAGGLAPLQGEQAGDLTGLERGAARVTRALAADERALSGLIDSGRLTFAVLAARESRLPATLQVAPDALETTRRQLAELEATLDNVDALAADLRPSTHRIAPTLDRLQRAFRTATPLLERAAPLVDRLRPALRALDAAAGHGIPLVRALAPVVRRLDDTTLPMLERADEGTKRPLYQLIGPLFSVLDSGGAATDGLGHLISFQAGVNARSGAGLLPCTAMLNDPTAAQRLTCAQLSTLLAQLMGRQPETMAPQDVTNPGRGGG